MSKECQCESCKSACQYKPGWFKPGEAELVAEHLGISLQELFDNYLGVDWWVADENIFLLAPAVIEMEPGEEYPADPKGQCVFFKDGLCDIYPVQPFECREYFHTDDHATTHERHRVVAEAWLGHQDQVEQLLGREPDEE